MPGHVDQGMIADLAHGVALQPGADYSGGPTAAAHLPDGPRCSPYVREKT